MSYYSDNYNQNFGHYHMRPKLFQGAIKILIIINLSVFAFYNILGLNQFFYNIFGLVPRYVWSKGFVWQLFTYMFIHGSFMHIFMNMFVLWMFGMELERHWGKKEFLKYYLVTGIGSGLITFLFSLTSPIPVVGASGAIYALLLAFAMMFPDRKIYIYFLFPVKAKYFVLVIGLITFFSSFNSVGSGISHLTHLGGLIIGYLYFRRARLFSDIKAVFKRLNIPNPFKKIIRKVDKDKKEDFSTFKTDETMREQVDIILDKISRNGYDSLTEQEKRTLYLGSQYFAKRDKQN